MSQWLGFTNQKLYQARLLLDQGDQAVDKALRDALEQGALYLTYDAYISYLNELAGMAAAPQPVDSIEDLLKRTPLVTGEMTELRVLREDSYSWLTAMLRAVAAQAQPATTTTQPDPSVNNLIAVVQETEQYVRHWWQALSDLIDSQRENRQES